MQDIGIIQDFLKKNHLSDARIEWMSGDASSRRYARVTSGEKSFILMDTPRSEKPEEFIMIDRLLGKAGLSVPEIYDVNPEKSLLLLEDLGDDTYTRMLEKGEEQDFLYTLAVDVLLEIARIRDVEGVALYDQAFVRKMVEAFTDWFMPAAFGKPTDAAAKKELLGIIDDLFVSIRDVPKGLMWLDYHVDNLMLLKNRKGVRACGLMDFQDARVGPLAYDLMSLLEDARRDVPEGLQQRLLAYYLEKSGMDDKDLFMRSYHVTAVKRHLRVIGVFSRLKMRDGKGKYLKHIPRVWRLLERHLNLPYMRPLKDWLDANIPQKFRTIPPSLEE